MVSVASTVWSKLTGVAGLVATPLVPSHYIQLFCPLAVSHTRQARVEAVRDEVPGVRTLVLRPSRGWRTHKPRQHVRVGIAIAGRVATRTYSISSSPDRRDGCFEITVKAQGRVSNALLASPIGNLLAISEAAGTFVMPEGAPIRALFITAGSGITPIASMMRSLASRGAMPDVVHVHFTRTPGEHIFGEELQGISDRHPCYRRVTIYTSDDSRRFCAARLTELVPDWREREAWACGPQGLLDAIAADFTQVGRAHALHVERFRAALAVLPANASGGRVTFTTTAKSAKSAKSAIADAATSILRVAEEAGLAPAHGCRMGICHTCDASLVSGCVRDLRTGATIDEPGARVQICVCAAAGDVELAL